MAPQFSTPFFRKTSFTNDSQCSQKSKPQMFDEQKIKKPSCRKMPKSKNSYSMTDEIESAQRSSGSEEVEVPENNVAQKKKITEYERQRMKRIEENRARMEALGLKKMANSFVGSLRKSTREMVDKKGKRKMDDDDEEYRPSDEGEEEALSSSTEDDDTNVDDEDYSGSSAKRKAKNRIQMPKKNVTPQKPVNDLDFVDDNDALLQAIALSLQDSAGFCNIRTGASQSSTGYHVNSRTNEGKENSHIQEDAGKRKRKKSMNSRVQMTEDELILHFFQLDEAGKGGITLRDLRRVAVAHDFTWSDKEMADMIKCFDIDGDGKVTAFSLSSDLPFWVPDECPKIWKIKCLGSVLKHHPPKPSTLFVGCKVNLHD